MSSNAENEKTSKVPTSTRFAPPTRPMAEVKADRDDDWEIVNEKDSQTESQAKNGGDLEKGPGELEEKTEDERRRELMKEKWDMRQQQGGVHPDREVKVLTYKSFVGDW